MMLVIQSKYLKTGKVEKDVQLSLTRLLQQARGPGTTALNADRRRAPRKLQTTCCR